MSNRIGLNATARKYFNSQPFCQFSRMQSSVIFPMERVALITPNVFSTKKKKKEYKYQQHYHRHDHYQYVWAGNQRLTHKSSSATLKSIEFKRKYHQLSWEQRGFPSPAIIYNSQEISSNMICGRTQVLIEINNKLYEQFFNSLANLFKELAS